MNAKRLLLLAVIVVGGCRRTQPALEIPADDVATDLSWSADGACAAFTLSNKDGHSPMTTTRAAVVERGSSAYREIRLPAPNERFSTMFDVWESPGVVRIRAMTLDGDVMARYSCKTKALEVVR